MTLNAFSFVGMYADALEAARHLLVKGAEFAAANDVPERDWLNWRLIDDMQPLSFQVMVICNFSTQWPARYAGLPVPDDVAADLDVAGLQKAVAHARSYLEQLTPAQFAGRDDVPLTYRLGTGLTATLPSGRWLSIFATTNIYFHVSTAYDILRSRGAPIGKADLFAGGL